MPRRLHTFAFSTALAAFAVAALAGGETQPAGPVIKVQEVVLVAYDKDRFNARGRREPGRPAKVLPYEGKFKLTMVVEKIEPGHSVKWMVWFGNVVNQGFSEISDLKKYRDERKPPATHLLETIAGFEPRFLGHEVLAFPKAGEKAEPSPGKPGAAYSFHPDVRGHNSCKYPLWMGPLREGENVLYGLVHQRFVYHLLFRLHKGHFARYDINQCEKLSSMVLPYTILLAEDKGGKKRLLSVYRGEVLLNAFPKDELRAGAGVTVRDLVSVPRQVWSRGGTRWGETKNGLRTGIVPPGAPFRVGQPMHMTVLVRNVSGESRTFTVMAPAGRVRRQRAGHDFQVRISDAGGKRIPLQGRCFKLHALEIVKTKAGETREFLLDLLDQGCYGVRKLPPGKYTVQVGHGELTTGTVPLKVLPAEAETRETRGTSAISSASLGHTR